MIANHPFSPFSRCLLAGLSCAAALWLASGTCRAQEERDLSPASVAQATDEAAPPSPPPHPLSPRVSLDTFLTLCREGRYAEAAIYLGNEARAGGEQSARRLKAVLDHHIWFDMSDISPLRDGDRDDGLPPGVERLGSISTPRGEAPVEMVLRPGDDSPGWVFAASTTARIDAWYAALDPNWLRDRVPAMLLRVGPLELQWWQWMALPVVLVLALAVARVAVSILRPLIRVWTRRSATILDDLILEKLGAPAILFLAVALFRAAVPFLDLVIPAQAFMQRATRVVVLAGIFWSVIRLVDVAFSALQQSGWVRQRQGLAPMIPVLGRTVRLVVLALGAVAILQEFDFHVTGLLAGMGLAGMAVALAGQKTVEHLIGSGTLLADQPFQPGDFVRVGDVVGTVEMIGLRSTRIRTGDRTRVTIPNGSLSEMQLETFAARDRIRLLCTLGLTYDTRVSQLRRVIGELEAVLREHPRLCDEPVRVRFVEFAASSLNLEVLAYIDTADWAEFLALRQEIFLRFMEVVEACGCEFAFPTQTIHIEPATAAGPAPGTR